MSMLNTENIAVGFAGKRVLENLNFAIEKGQIISILGPNGSGKSTLLKILSRNLKPDQGKIYLDGQNLADLNNKIIARKMAVLPQSPEAPKDLTVRDLVEYGRYPHQHWWQGKSQEDDECVRWALEQTGLEEMSDRIVSTLSGGERQRVWIAMALAQKPEVLLLDEPTTYLDICHQLEIMELLAEFNRVHGITIAMVLHDINHAAKYSDCVAVLHQGKVFAVGKPEEVITSDTLRAVFGVESKITMDDVGKPVIFITGLTKKRG